MPPATRSSRRCLRFESDDSDSEDASIQEPLSREEQARLAQIQITMEDLSGAVRHKMTAQDIGHKAKPVNVSALLRGRDCNQQGSKANDLAMENKQALSNWSTYGQTADAKAAGVEILPDIAAGNSHRERVKREMEEQGLTKLEDTYDERRPRGVPPASRNHAGAAAAMANDRGRYGSARGGGNVGRGVGRGASMAASPSGRPLDPAVDPDRPYSLKSKAPKKKPGVRGEMVQGTVIVKAANKQHGFKKKPGQYSSPRLDRGPLPDHVLQGVSPKLVDDATFMQATLDMFKKQAESGKHIIAEKQPKAVDAAQTMTPSVAVTDPAPAQSKVSSQVDPALTNKYPEVQYIERKELGVVEKSPDAFTDGNATNTSLSGFTPSLASRDGAVTANSLAGLGIQGAAVQGMCKSSLPSTTDLMDVDIPGAKKSSLKSPLQASPRDPHFSATEYEEYKLLKEFKAYVDARNSQDFTQWFNKQKSGSTAVRDTSKETHAQGNARPVAISSGYTIGGSSLERILGDDKNIATRNNAAKTTQTTQTTPGLAQSKWAYPEVQVLPTFQESSAGQAMTGRTKRKLDTVQEGSAPVASTQPDFTKEAAKRPNPFDRREDSDNPAAQPTAVQAVAPAAESTKSSVEEPRRVEQIRQGHHPGTKSASTKKDLSSSKWATESLTTSSVAETPRHIAGLAKSTKEHGSIFGDSHNVQKSPSVLAPIAVNTSGGGKGLSASKFATTDPPSPGHISSLRPFARGTAPTTLHDGYIFKPGVPIVHSTKQAERSSIIGEKNIVQNPPTKWGRDSASQSTPSIERKTTGIKRTNAGPGYDWIMHEQKAQQEKLLAEKAAAGPKSVDEIATLADQYKDMYVTAEDSEEEL